MPPGACVAPSSSLSMHRLHTSKLGQELHLYLIPTIGLTAHITAHFLVNPKVGLLLLLNERKCRLLKRITTVVVADGGDKLFYLLHQRF